MAVTYTYKGIQGNKYTEGKITALNKDEAAFKLKEEKIIITSLYKISGKEEGEKSKKATKKGKKIPKKELFDLFESFRSKDPIVYNIETTNACNMRCKMCPRTTRMTRDITFLDLDYTENVVKQLKPHFCRA